MIVACPLTDRRRCRPLLTGSLLAALSLTALAAPAAAQTTWRSTLYPSNWTPGYKDAQGRFLHDFGYAGYRRGEAPIPSGPPNGATLVVNAVTQYSADNTGATDTTVALQNALDAVGSAGGGVVYLPAGIYRIQPQGTNVYALWMKYSNVVLRGAGAGQTFLFNAATYMRSKEVIRIYPSAGGNWTTPVTGSPTAYLTQDYNDPTRSLKVDNVSGFAVGDWVVVRADATTDFIADHDMTGWWSTSGQTGPTFYRQILAVHSSTGTLVLDIPTRYWLKTRDNARVYKVNPAITGVGLEDFSIGNAQNTKTGFGDTDFNTSGTGAYDVHASHVVAFRHALDGWMRRVNTYRPSGNAGDFHMLSNGLLLHRSRSITVEDCTWSKPQYRGEGGNGYAFTLQGNDCLLRNLVANNTRHNYDFKTMTASGNVLVRCTSNTPRLAADFHMHLSMSNLLDNMTLNQDYIDATVRPYGSSPNYHGVTTSQSVFWNTKGTAYPSGKTYIINSQQWGWGYIIGTQGAASAVRTTPTSFTASSISPNPVDTAPEDFKEGIGLGTTLAPVSLYDDQRARRDMTYNVTADAYIRGGTYASQNFGTASSLMVKDAPNTDNSYDRIAFFKVPFTGYPDPAANAARFYFYSSGTETGAAVPITVYGLTSNAWTESGITWNNQPSMSGAVALGTVTVTAAGWYSIDVTNYVNSRISADKTATFKLVEENTLNKYANINSREAASNKPYLHLTR
jgi:hypothetical protein